MTSEEWCENEFDTNKAKIRDRWRNRRMHPLVAPQREAPAVAEQLSWVINTAEKNGETILVRQSINLFSVCPNRNHHDPLALKDYFQMTSAI